jgi:hypothetical protein
VLGAVPLTHGFQDALYVLAGLAVAGAVIAAVFIESAPRRAPAEVEPEAAMLEEAA